MFWFPCPYATGIAGVTGHTGGRGRTNDTLGAAGNGEVTLRPFQCLESKSLCFFQKVF